MVINHAFHLLKDERDYTIGPVNQLTYKEVRFLKGAKFLFQFTFIVEVCCIKIHQIKMMKILTSLSFGKCSVFIHCIRCLMSPSYFSEEAFRAF